MKIVDFTYGESTATQRKMIRNEIEILIYNSSLNNEIKESLLHIVEFKEFLIEVLNVSSSSLGRISKQKNLIVQPSDEDEFDKASVSEPITAFHNFVEGNYSGVVEFNLVLSKSGENGSKGTLNGVVNYKNNISENIKSRVGNLRKQLKSKSILGTIIIIVITGFMAAQAASGNQNAKAAVSSKNPSEVLQNISSTDSGNPNNLPDTSAQANIYEDKFEEMSDKAEVDAGVEHGRAESNGDLAKPNIEAEIDTKSDAQTDAASYPTASTTATAGEATDSTADKVTNTSDNATINNSVVIEGDNNILGQGSNIYIHIGD